MPNAHATLGPSGAARWMRCPASIRMAEKAPRQGDSPHAAEGTMAHELAEIEAGYQLLTHDRPAYQQALSDWTAQFQQMYGDDAPRLAEMRQHVQEYVALLDERLQAYPSSTLMLERRVETGVPRCWGTADAIILSPQHIEVIDLKYGKGVPVDAEENPQLMLYGVGALDTYGDILGDVEHVTVTVHQPRLDSISSYTVDPAALRAWRTGVVAPLARQALTDRAPFNPSEEACHWCPAAGICRPRMEHMLREDFGPDPDLISPEDLADVLPRLKDITAWCGDVKASALHRAYSLGETIPGHKVVKSGGRRVFSDDAIAIQTLIDNGYPASDVATTKLKGVTTLEKLLGKEDFTALLQPFIHRTEGSLSLVPDTDKRRAVNPEAAAADDFAEGGE